jgi:hypothetical protein
MALVSPGVEVTIIDQSQYLPPASSSVPLLVVATAQNKANAAGTGVAVATTASNANKLYQVTSQRDLVNLFGTPFFYKTTNGTPIQGYELNEYGLLAAYSLMGATNRCFILRADVDLASLVGTLSRPVGSPVDGTYWLDTTESTWGIFEFNAQTGKFVNREPIVITETSQITEDRPASSVGTIGSYAVIPFNITTGIFSRGTYFYKTTNNEWVVLGSQEWKSSIPTVTGTVVSPEFENGWSFAINMPTDSIIKVINVDSSTTLGDIANEINNLGITYLTAAVVNSRLSIFYSNPNINNPLVLSNLIGTPLNSMGLLPRDYYNPDVVYGTSAQMPLWTANQTYPHPTGSVWIKTSVVGGGINLSMQKFSESTESWSNVPVRYFRNSASAIATLDTTGGKSIPADTIFAYSGSHAIAGTVFYKRKRTGSTVVTGNVVNPVIPVGQQLYVTITVPGSNTLSQVYTITTTSSQATDFITNWLAANIPFTNAVLNSDGAIEITHTEGGDIILSDLNPTTLVSSGLVNTLGFGPNNPDIIYTIPVDYEFDNLLPTTTTGTGDGMNVYVSTYDGYYTIVLNSGGADYQEGDLVTVPGTSLGGSSPQNDLVLRVQKINGDTGAAEEISYLSGFPSIPNAVTVSNWEYLEFTPNEGRLATNPLNGTNWFYSSVTDVDIMVNKGGEWVGYRNQAYDRNGHPIPNTVGNTNPTGVIIATSSPRTQTDGTQLEFGDLWLDSSDLENYPMIYRWQEVQGINQWVSIDVSDQTSEDGILFADARWANSGTVDPVNDPLVPVQALLTSDYLDLDAPSPSLYPQGILLFNTRRSGYNVKKFTTNYFTRTRFPEGELPLYSYTWVTASGLKPDGSAYMGRKAQRNMVVQAMKAAINTNQSILEEDTFFNLIAAPNYPELQPDMVVLNNNRNNTAYIIGDTPLRLADQATDITNWANNVAGATSTGEEGLVTRDEYMGLFYPSGITTDLTGAQVVVPASHMMLRTILRNDTVAYPWFAPAGTRRGTIDNATNIGYLNSSTGEFVTVKNRMSIRDVLYTNQINPLAFFTGVGLLNYGNKNTKDTQSALDRINVSRLVCYIRERLQVVARPFVFEPNDSITRNQITAVVQSLFIDLVAKRGLYDYLVVCDESNNTPARIDRNELWVDVAIEPVKAAEFIYIPVRVLNTGELATL